MVDLKWPIGRGQFIDRDAERSPTDSTLTVSPGQTISVDDPDVASHYQDRGFVAVDGGSDGSDPGGSTSEDGIDGGSSADDDFDVESFVDRTPVSDVVEDIEAGDVDGHLDAVEATADRVSVEQAVEDRRDAIGGE